MDSVRHASSTDVVELARLRRWSDLEQAWLSAIESSEELTQPTFLSAVDLIVQGGQSGLAETLAWAWLTRLKESAEPHAALHIARKLLLRLPDGDGLREEVLGLYRVTHTATPDLERWIEMSGLAAGKSVRRALRFLDVGLQLAPGAFLLHRSEDVPAEVIEADLAAGRMTLRTPRGNRSQTVEDVIEHYDPVDATDFRVLSQLRPDAIKPLLETDPETFLVGIARSHRNRIDRDELKLLLVPRLIGADAWSDWWTKIRNVIKRSKHLRVEGRSPMFVVYEPGGTTAEQEALSAFEKAKRPRQWLDAVEAYFRDCRQRRAEPVYAADAIDTGREGETVFGARTGEGV
jgi:transcription elongation factor GreA-like protein